MSKIGKKPVNIPDGVKVEMNNDLIEISNAKGEMLKIEILDGVRPVIEGNEITFQLVGKKKQDKSNWGTLRSHVNNAIEGLTAGFEKTLLLEGVGYRMYQEGEGLRMSLGFSHEVRVEPREGVVFELEGTNKIKIKGYDKQKVGQTAAEIRSFRPVEPYKGKGFRYSDEIVRRKAGKKAASGIGS